MLHQNTPQNTSKHNIETIQQQADQASGNGSLSSQAQQPGKSHACSCRAQGSSPTPTKLMEYPRPAKS
ncbi:hypothetical protein MtrunA17_Chr8g0361121 [Medicago truncatula]|uniref:Uncharacterized protein n=1 Tax=Medicago truncatula TaxID=3880 RepID=A0A396GIL5_MEDTR|nr:hypothetical protein MtrunA17_Chr8g0361121 [Medicago truncatula]